MISISESRVNAKSIVKSRSSLKFDVISGVPFKENQSFKYFIRVMFQKVIYYKKSHSFPLFLDLTIEVNTSDYLSYKKQSW